MAGGSPGCIYIHRPGVAPRHACVYMAGGPPLYICVYTYYIFTLCVFMCGRGLPLCVYIYIYMHDPPKIYVLWSGPPVLPTSIYVVSLSKLQACMGRGVHPRNDVRLPS